MNDIESKTLELFQHFIGAIHEILFVGIALSSLIFTILGIIGFFEKKHPIGEVKADSEPLVTVHIPTYNELAAVNCAKACLAFDWPQKKLQIIIGDDSNLPEISREIDKFAQNYPDQILVTRRGKNIGYKSGNLNHMTQFSTGEFIVGFDSDHMPPKKFLRNIIFPFQQDNTLAAVQTRWKLANLNQNLFSVSGGVSSLIYYHAFMPFMKINGDGGLFGGSGYAIRKTDLITIGGWRPGALSEDVEGTFELMKNGKKITYLNSVTVECEAPFTFKDLCNQQKRWACGSVIAFKKNIYQILKSKQIALSSKFNVLIFILGYFYSNLSVLYVLFGVIESLISPLQPSSTQDLGGILLYTVLPTIFTSGSIITGILSLCSSGNAGSIPKYLLGTVLFGLIVLIFVNIGIYQALFDIHLDWITVEKNGNRSQITYTEAKIKQFKTTE